MSRRSTIKPGGSGGSSGAASSLDVVQANSFAVGDAVYFTGSAWAKAQSNNVATLGVAIVSAASASSFTAQFSGPITGLSGLTAGQYYFVSDASAGTLTATEPTATTSYSNPVLLATSATAGIVLPFRPNAVQGGIPLGRVGAYASRPAAGISGSTYYPTDGYTAFVDDGSAWRPLINGVAGVQPSAASTFTAVNQLTSTLTDDAGALIIEDNTNTTTQSQRLYVKALSGASGVEGAVWPTNDGTSFSLVGIALRESATGKISTFTLFGDANNSNLPSAVLDYCPSPTAGRVVVRASVLGIDLTAQPLLMRLYVSGGNVRAEINRGRGAGGWKLWSSVATTTAFTTTPDQYGLVAWPFNSVSGGNARAIVPHLTTV